MPSGILDHAQSVFLCFFVLFVAIYCLHRTDITVGLGWKLARGAMLKVDYQVFKNGASDDSKQQFNAGVAVWF